jgi:hypothetical protein
MVARRGMTPSVAAKQLAISTWRVERILVVLIAGIESKKSAAFHCNRRPRHSIVIVDDKSAPDSLTPPHAFPQNRAPSKSPTVPR